MGFGLVDMCMLTFRGREWYHSQSRTPKNWVPHIMSRTGESSQ